MKKIAHHLMLVTGESHKSCRKQVKNYFARTELVRYDRIEIDDKACLAGSHQNFARCLDEAIAKNKNILEGLIKDLENTGVKTTGDLLKLKQGYPSKVLHIATHFLDGFIGIDSSFYNLIDDSHWLPERTRQAIAEAPDDFWLIQVDGFSETPEKAALIRM
jgi:hypothetical protein